MTVELDLTRLKVPVKKHDNCTVIDVSSGAFPRYIEVRMPGKDGARRTALWDGLLRVSNNDKVMCEEYPGNPVLRIVGFGGEQDAQSTTIWTRTGTEIDPTNDGDSLVLHDSAATERLELNPGTPSTEAFWEVRNQSGELKLRLSTDNLYRFLVSSGGLDTSQNVFRVDVTGTPQLEWGEAEDRFLWNKGHEITAGDVLIPDDLVHYGDPDTLRSFTDDAIEDQAGGIVLLRLTETTQDLVEIGDVAGTGDVDININAGQVFVRGSDGYVGIATGAPQKLLQVGAGTDAPTQSYEGIYVAIDGIAQIAIRNNTDNVEGGLFSHSNNNVYVGSWTNSPLILTSNNADRLEINAAGHKILKSTLPLRGESSNFPDIGSTTLAEKLGNTYLGTDKDFYPHDDEAGLFQRDPNHFFTAITTHFADMTGWSWAAYTGFVTPANIDVSTYPSLAAIFNSAAQGNVRAFAYRSSFGSDIRGRLSPPPLDVRTGIRMDDGTNDNYIELWAEGLSGGLFRVQYRYAIGGVVTGPTTLWGGSTFPLQWIGFRLLRSGDNVFMYYHIDTLSELFFTNVAITGWSPTRSGIMYDHYTGATFNSSRQSLYDWYKQ